MLSKSLLLKIYQKSLEISNLEELEGKSMLKKIFADFFIYECIARYSHIKSIIGPLLRDSGPVFRKSDRGQKKLQATILNTSKSFE